MKENFIDMEISEDDKDKNAKNKSTITQNKKQIFSYKIPKKRKVCDIDKIFLTTSKNPDTGKFFLDRSFSQSKSSKNKNKVNDNKYEEYEVIEMNMNDKILKACYDYLINNHNLKEKQEITLNILDNEITFTLAQIQKNNFFTILINSTAFIFENNAREISFVNEKSKKIIKRFIYNPDNLKSCLVDLGFKSYYVKIDKNKIVNNITNFNSIKEQESDSESSEVSLDPFKIFLDNGINYIFNENQRPILNDENFNKRFNDSIVQLKDLNNNSKYYYKSSDKNFHILNNYEQAITNFRFFKYSSTSKIAYLYGPKSSSKTTFLLYMINFFRYIYTPELYILILIIYKI